MYKGSNIRLALCSVAITLTLTGLTAAQSRPAVEKPGVQNTRTSSKPATDAQQKGDPDRVQPDYEELMRQTLGDLSKQVGALTAELHKLRKQNERNNGIMELLLNENRLAKIEDKIQETLDQKAQLDQRELGLQRRMKNIQAELLFMGAVRRDEAEAAIRADLQRSLDEVHGEQAVNRQRLTELQTQADRLRQRVDGLVKKLEPVEVNANDK